jgi:hypothetical protein
MSVPRARKLRRESTDAERRMWFLLRRKQFEGYKFRRQEPIGTYIVDIVWFRPRLIIEIDAANITCRTNPNRTSAGLLGSKERASEYYDFGTMTFYKTQKVTLKRSRLLFPIWPSRRSHSISRDLRNLARRRS